MCDGVAAHLDSRDAEAHLTLEAMAVLCGLLDDSTASSVADRARALLFEATERAVPRQALAVAAFAAALTNQPADQVADLARRAIAAGPTRSAATRAPAIGDLINVIPLAAASWIPGPADGACLGSGWRLPQPEQVAERI